jgi:hypothetical protein
VRFPLLAAMWAGSALAEDQSPAQIISMRSANFVATLGVNKVGSLGHKDPERILFMLAHIGFRNIRQTLPINTAGMANIQALAKRASKSTFVNGGGPVDLSGAMASVKQRGRN